MYNNTYKHITKPRKATAHDQMEIRVSCLSHSCVFEARRHERFIAIATYYLFGGSC